MKQCPMCFQSNPATATVCRCGALLDQSPMNLTRTCPAGTHVMDPTWTVCAFCKASGVGSDEPLRRPAPQYSAPPPARATLYDDSGSTGRKTLEQRAISDSGGFAPSHKGGTAFEGLLPVDAGRGVGPVDFGTEFDPSIPGRTLVQDPPAFENSYSDSFQNRAPVAPKTAEPSIRASGTPPIKKTEFGIVIPGGGISIGDAAPAGAPLQARREPGRGDGQRKIVAVLVSYTWKPEGECFPVREGRNWIGRNPDAEVSLAYDPTLSAINTSIVCRDGKFMITDKDSMGGTDLDGKTVWPEQVLPLSNYSRIRTGSTTWTFIVIEPPAAE